MRRTNFAQNGKLISQTSFSKISSKNKKEIIKPNDQEETKYQSGTFNFKQDHKLITKHYFDNSGTKLLQDDDLNDTCMILNSNLKS